MERVLKREKSWLTNKRRYLERKNFSIYFSRVLAKICFLNLGISISIVLHFLLVRARKFNFSLRRDLFFQ